MESELTIFPVESKDIYPDGLTTIAPIYGGGMRLGSLIIWRNDNEFSDEDLILVEISSTVVGIQLLNLQTENLKKRSASKLLSTWLLTPYLIQK